MGLDEEPWFAAMRVTACFYPAVMVFVTVAASIAAARIRRSKGAWIFAGAVAALTALALLLAVLDLLDVHSDAMMWFWAATSVADLFFVALLILGVVLIRPPRPAADAQGEAGR